MKKYILWLMVLCTPMIGLARVYPVQEVTINNCLKPYEEPCTLAMPHINGADYTGVKDEPIFRRLYKVLWGATDINGRDRSAGSHKGVDIASVAGTSVYAMWSGKVIEAGWRGERGNVVIVEHKLGSKKIRSTYAHLDEVLIRKGDTVDEGDKIGEIGKSGNASGPHVHRQIDINQTGPHPYHPSGCGDDLELIINEWKCRKQVLINTIDPIAFVETQGKSLGRDTDKSIPTLSLQTSIQLAWFAGGYIPLNTTKILKIIPQMSGDIDDPITITSLRGGTDIFPNKVLFLGTQRSIFVTAQEEWLDILQIKQGTTLLQSIPVIIGTGKTFPFTNDAIVTLWQSFTH